MGVLVPRIQFCLLGTSPWSSGSCAGFPARRNFSGMWRRRPALRLRMEASTFSDGGRPEPLSHLELVEVIGIGSRKDAVINFCLNSPSVCTSRFRFWTIQARDSLKVQLLQRSNGTGTVQRDLEFPLSLHSCPPAIILVGSSGHGSNHITALELLEAVKSAGGLAAAILLKPFNFEGQRRQQEVEYLEVKLKDSSIFHIVVEADFLLKREAETLAEALETANNAVFLALSTISIMISESHLKLRCSPNGQRKEVKPMEVVKLLQTYGEAKVGFGVGYDVKSSIEQAIFHCPLLTGNLKDLNGLVILTFASASDVDECDLHSAIIMLRQIVGCKGEIIVSIVQEPHLDSTIVIATLLIVGNQKSTPHKRSILMSLAQHFPFLSPLLGRSFPQPKNDNVACASKFTSFASNLSEDISELDSANGIVDCHNQSPQEIKNEVYIKESSPEIRSETGSSDCAQENDLFHKNNPENLLCHTEQSNSQNELPSSWNVGPEFHIAQRWAKERSSLPTINKANEIGTFTLPVGIKPSELSSNISLYNDPGIPENLGDMNYSKESMNSQTVAPRGVLADAGLEAVLEIYNSALTLIKGRTLNESKNNGLLSARASSMLEAERESQKSWTPIMEIQYKGGSYRGRCQGGLPEGKGRLTFEDDSFYDGMWRNGKRCGLGTLYYSNGDVFQGSWRDDLMHGKGWFYFRSGDRWFANFWKGKANGEGRFYSKGGSIYFGNFKNGWRHGQSLCIDIDGSRWTEMWEEGVLITRTQLDSATSG